MSTSEKILFDNRIKRKNVLALNEKVAAIREFEKTPVYKHVGRSFNCSPDQIKRIIQQKDDILKAWEQRTRRCNEVKSLEMKSVRVSMLGKSVYEWIRRMMYYKDFIITDGLIQKMALQFKSALGIQVFFPHQDWCDKFRQMYNIHDNDTKNLKIAYTVGQSVQIKDIIRDILVLDTELDDDTQEDTLTEDKAVGAGNKSNTIAKGDDDNEENSDDDENYEEEEDDDEEDEKYEPPPRRPKRPSRVIRKKTATRSKVKQTAAAAAAPPRPIAPKSAPSKTAATTLPKRHLVAVKLPLSATQNNGNKLPQQVLVATPITPHANGSKVSTPLTMTIIPLASVAQSLNSARAQLPGDKPPLMPIPNVEIKREIEEDEPMIEIKKEYITDDEEENEAVSNTVTMGTTTTTTTATTTTTTTSTTKKETPESLSFAEQIEANARDGRLTTVVHTAISRTDSEQSEEEDNLVLAQLQKGLMTTAGKTQNNSKATGTPVKSAATTTTTAGSFSHDSRVAATPNNWPVAHNSPPPLNPLPAMPPLTRAPTAINSTSSNKRRHAANYDQSPPLPPITSCSEARKYLKLLEDFALVKENFRLIGLITRADEVLRELDGDDDVDVV